MLRANRKDCFEILVVSVILMCFMPSDALGQIAPMLFIVIYIALFKQNRTKTIFKLGIVSLLLVFALLFYYVISVDFVVSGYILFCITISSFAIVFIDFRHLLVDSSLRIIQNGIMLVFIIEGVYATLQVVAGFLKYGSYGGDFVTGTVDLRLTTYGGAGNTTFSLLMMTIIIFYACIFFRGLRKDTVGNCALLLSIFACLSASVNHQILLLAIALVCACLCELIYFDIKHVSIFIHGKFFRISFRLIIAFILLQGLVNLVTPGVYYSAYNKIDGTINFGSPRSVVTKFVLTELPHVKPMSLLWGLGPGQFSSRASLISSGQYLNVSVPFVNKTTSLSEEYILTPLIQSKERRGAGGPSSSFFDPQYGWLTVYSETGIIGLTMIMTCFLLLFARFSPSNTQSSTMQRARFAGRIFLFLLLLLPFWENYWERTQAIFPLVLLTKILYSFANTKNHKHIIEK